MVVIVVMAGIVAMWWHLVPRHISKPHCKNAVSDAVPGIWASAPSNHSSVITAPIPSISGRARVVVPGSATGGFWNGAKLYSDNRCWPWHSSEPSAAWMHMYEVEAILLRAAAMLPASSGLASVTDADLLLLPLSVTCEIHRCDTSKKSASGTGMERCKQLVTRDLVNGAAAALEQALPEWWLRRRPAVVIAAAWDRGREILHRGSASISTLRLLEHAVWLEPMRPQSMPFARSVIVPPLAMVPRESAAQSDSTAIALRVEPLMGRPLLFTFAGSILGGSQYSRGFRQELAHIYGSAGKSPGCWTDGDGRLGAQGRSRGVLVAHTLSAGGGEYAEALATSDFALCPEGWSPWTPRPFEALAALAVPVIASEVVELPGSGWLDWQAFSLRIPAGPESARAVEAQLRRLPAATVHAMRLRGLAAAPFVSWRENAVGVADWVLAEALQQWTAATSAANNHD